MRSVQQQDPCTNVLYDLVGRVAVITLNRPEVQNAISTKLLNRLCECLLAAQADDNVRAIVLTGRGKFFSAGLDLREAGTADDLLEEARTANLDLRNTPPTILSKLDKPVICALGSAAGYGLDLALGCDIRIMSASAKLSAAFVARGILPESGGTWILPRLIGWSKAAEILFTAKILTAEAALDMGIVSKVVPDGDLQTASIAMAQTIADNAPKAVQATKRMMRMGLDQTFDTHVYQVFLQLLPLLSSEDFQEGKRAFADKRPPRFKGT
jgi:enoyl-CoA hydratase/carnithine racemase